MSMVLDASMTLSWYFEDESTADTDNILDLVKEDGAVVPCLWPLEVANGLHMALRRKRITPHYRDDSLERLRQFPITVDTETNTYAWSTTLSLAQRFGLTPYDAAYLELANRRTLPLATLDKDLAVAATALGVRVMSASA